VPSYITANPANPAAGAPPAAATTSNGGGEYVTLTNVPIDAIVNRTTFDGLASASATVAFTTDTPVDAVQFPASSIPGASASLNVTSMRFASG